MGDKTQKITAVLTAKDNMTSTMDSAFSKIKSIGSSVKSGLGFGMLMGAGQQCFDVIKNSAVDLVSEVNSSNKTWKTFDSNMKTLGKSSKEIDKLKKGFQDYAQQTIYSSSDMASTYTQLESVGVKSADKLVKSFAGLSAAAENPQQSMKSLSQQAVQMAAKPKVAWEDFKIMLEQSPAGLSQVAASMGKTMTQLVSDVQAGTVSTDEFFQAIQRVGMSDSYQNLATQAKGVDEAMDGLKESIANKVGPAFELLSTKAISVIDGIANKVGAIDGEALKEKLGGFLEQAQPYWESFKTVGSGVIEVLQLVGSAIGTVTGFFLEHSTTIAPLIPMVSALALGFGGLTILGNISGPAQMFTSALSSLGKLPLGSIVTNLLGVGTAAGTEAVGASASVGPTLAAGAAFLFLGGGIALAALGISTIATAAISLSDAGGAAIAIAAGMTVAIAGLALGAAIIGPALTVGAVGMLAFGAAVTLVGAGVLLASTGLKLVASALPTIASSGASAAAGLMMISAALIATSAGSLVASAALLVLTVSAVAVAGGMVVLAAGAVVGAAGLAVFGAAALLASAGTVVLAGSLVLVKVQMKAIQSSAKSTSSQLKSMVTSVNVVKAGLNALGSIASSAMNKLKTAFSSAEKKVLSSGKAVGNNFANGMKPGLQKAVSAAQSTSNSIYSALNGAAPKASSAGKSTGSGFSSSLSSSLKGAVSTARSISSSIPSALNSGASGANSAGRNIGLGFANGMSSMLGRVRSIAAQLASAANAAIAAKAKIGSPSKVTDKFGRYVGEGFINGMAAMTKQSARTAAGLFSIPAVRGPELCADIGGSISGGFSLGSEYSYSSSGTYTIEVPVEINGREVAKATAAYTQTEIEKRTQRENRKRGKV